MATLAQPVRACIGYFPKIVRSNQGELELQIPRDCRGEFQPQAVKKHPRDVSEIADKIISMYAKE